MTLFTTEYGHWLALLCFLLMLCSFRKPKVLIFLIPAFILFLMPVIQFGLNRATWQHQLGLIFPDRMEPRLALNSADLFSLPKKTLPETLQYSEVSHLSLDFYRAKNVKAPFVLVIHGGGWNGGDRSYMAEFNSELAARGYAVAAISYRLAPNFHWPAPKEDVLEAVKFIKAHSASLNIDPNRWVILGRSAGGQIAESVAYSVLDPTLKGCIAFYAPADLSYAYVHAKEDDILKSPGLLRDYIGGDPKQLPRLYEDSSPILSVVASSPPTLLFHGPKDTLVWVRQSERLFAKLQERHVPSAFIKIPWAMHGFDYNPVGPGGQLSAQSIFYFLGMLLP